MSFCASSLRCSESAASCANKRRFDRMEYRPVSRMATRVSSQKKINLPLYPVINLGHS